MKILVAIASYGTNNDAYLQRLLDEYQSMPHEIHIVVLSNIQKNLGPHIEVAVGLPSSNPWSLPFAHKDIFARRVDDFDLFIYSEDDTLITQAHIDAFIWATSILEPEEIAGFLRSEEAADGTRYYSTIHNHYHWDVNSVCVRHGETFAHFTNEHGACYLLTQSQLKRAIASGGFCVPPHEGKYDLLVSAATDPYTQCGFKKLVCISRLESFTCKHLTNKYIGRTGISADLVDLQVKAMMAAQHEGQARLSPMRVEPRLPSTRWIKSYYEPCQDALVSLVPSSARRVLSIGCGWGATEEALSKKSIEVTAIPLDRVIGSVAAARGIRIVPADIVTGPAKLAGEHFDVLLISGLLHLLDDPVEVLRQYRQLLDPSGIVILSFPNLNHASVWWRRIKHSPSVKGMADFRRSGMHLTNLSLVTRWLKSAGYAVEHIEPLLQGRWRRYDRATLGTLRSLLASDYALLARSLATQPASVPARSSTVGLVGALPSNTPYTK